ncbi:MarR family transcriptional regulator [Clostridium sp. MCC353]|uniref:MarR family winged helix-turn-helix transcriptional regulator n=1 Tax=Clostridium sp. MCC353 TaxID=2592646 RepID=UPI001C021074|nr:MarR family transcriptional regulator [Clostridium sp. MCC353]MBT9777950.1 MarR family transcriptional regulator [Clostridium sp. MCC353]
MEANLNKYASIIYRQAQRYFDKELEKHGIGCGQQFFLLHINSNEGISMYDLARLGHFDKGTVTKAVQKLEEEGLIRIEVDPKDRRMRRLYTTRKAEEVVKAAYDLRETWFEILTEGLTDEEVRTIGLLMSRMAENAYDYMNGGI